jgi:hypothetical protein
LRHIDEATALALEGSRPADTFTVWVWRGGSLLLPEPLPVITWSVDDSAGDSVKIGQQLHLTVADPAGELGAWRFDDTLGVGGTRLQVVYRVGGAGAVNFAWFRITANEPDEVIDWREIDEYGYDEPDSQLGPHKRMVPVVQSVVKIEAVDITYNADLDKLEGPESPADGATAISEFKRLTEDHFPVVVDPGVADLGVSRLLVFDRERLEAGQDLLTRIGARYRMGGDGECHIYPRTTDPVWRVGPGQCMVSVGRKQAIGGLFNRWVVEGKDAGTSAPVRATVSIDTGPLRFGGDHGKAQTFYTSEMITSQDQALAYGQQLRAEFLASLAIELQVEITPRPELQAGDRIEVGYPIPAGYVAYLPGEITAIKRSGTNVPGGTTLTVSCSYTDVITALTRTDWAQHITGGTPELTWDRMPGNWGTLPVMTWNDLP